MGSAQRVGRRDYSHSHDVSIIWIGQLGGVLNEIAFGSCLHDTNRSRANLDGERGRPGPRHALAPTFIATGVNNRFHRISKNLSRSASVRSRRL